MNLMTFYHQHFNDDPYILLDAGFNDLVTLAGQAGIDWSQIATSIILSESRGSSEKFSKYSRRKIPVLDKKLKGRVEVYSKLVTSKEGIKFPFINFVCKGFDAGSWSGFQFLLSEYKKTSETTVSISNSLQKRIKIQAQKRLELAEKQRISRLIQLQHRDRALLSFLDFQNKFNNACLESGSHNYAIKKGISDIFKFVNCRTFKEKDNGSYCLAIPLHHLDNRLDGRLAGWQRIYDNGSKRLTPAIDENDYSGACHIIGSLEQAKKVAVTEGFATAASIYLSNPKKYDAVLMAVSANNMPKVIDQLVELYPYTEITALLDNDKASSLKGKGNTGLRIGIEMLKKHKSLKCTYPIFDDPHYTDFNDLFLLKGKREVKKQLVCRKNQLKITSDDFETELLILSVTPTQIKKSFINQINRCINAGMSRCPAIYSPTELKSIIMMALKPLGVDSIYKGMVKSRILKQFNKKVYNAQAARSFSEKITNKYSRPNHITYKKFDTPTINNEILNYIKTLTGPVIVRAGMGSGKSKHLLRPLMHSSDRGISLAHRVSLIGGLWDMMSRNNEGVRQKTDLIHYQDPIASQIGQFTNKLICCVNSIIKGCWRPIMSRHDFLGFDEATQGIRSICTGGAMQYPVDVFNRLIDSIAVTEDHAVLVDADANDSLVDLCELALVRREKLGLSPWTKIHVIELPVDVTYIKDNEKRKRSVYYTDINRIVTEVLNCVEQGEKFLLATDTKNFAAQVIDELKVRYPNKKFLYISQDVKQEKEVIDFTEAPNEKAILYDGLIYSPAISSGVSIEVSHFTKHFGAFHGEIVPSDAVQMLRRDRTATEFVIGLSTLIKRKETNKQNLKTGYIQAMIDTGEITNLFTDAEYNNGILSLGLADTDYTNMKIKLMAMEAAAKNDFANNLICILHGDGYKIHHLAKNDSATLEGTQVRKNAKSRVWDASVIRHLETKTPTEEEKNILLAKNALTEEEKAKLTRFEIENDLFLPVSEFSLKFLIDGGKRKINLVELQRMSEQEAANIDRIESSFIFNYQFKAGNDLDFMNVTAINREEADLVFYKAHPNIKPVKVNSKPLIEVPTRTFATLHRKLSLQYFKDCGIDINTGAGEVTIESMSYAMNNLITQNRLHMFNNVIRFGGFATIQQGKPKCPTSLFKQIMNAHGYELERKRLSRQQGRKYVWSICKESWKFINTIIENRLNHGVKNKAWSNISNDKAILDLNINYKIMDKNDDNQSDLEWCRLLDDSIKDLPIDREWAKTVLNENDRNLFLDGAISSGALTPTLISLYLFEKIHLLGQDDIDKLKNWDSVNNKTN